MSVPEVFQLQSGLTQLVCPDAPERWIGGLLALNPHCGPVLVIHKLSQSYFRAALLCPIREHLNA